MYGMMIEGKWKMFYFQDFLMNIFGMGNILNFVFIQYYFEKKVNNYVFFFYFKFCNEISDGLGLFAETLNCDLAEYTYLCHLRLDIGSSSSLSLLMVTPFFQYYLISLIVFIKNGLNLNRVCFKYFLFNIFDMASPNTCSCLIFRTHHFIILSLKREKKEEFFKVNKMCGWIFVFVPQKKEKKKETKKLKRTRKKTYIFINNTSFF